MKIFILVFLMILFSSPTYALKQLNLTSGEWPPYLSENLKDNGFVSALVREAYKAVDIDVTYGYFPWKRSYYYAVNGESEDKKVWHGSVVWLYTQEREKLFNYSAPVLTEEGVLYFLKSKAVQWDTVEDLRGLIIGGTSHTLYPLFEAAQKEGILRLQRAGNYEALFNRLLAGRIDAILNIKGVARYYIHTRYTREMADKITFSPTVFEKRTYYLILSKAIPENKKYIELFNQGMEIIKSNGTYDRLMTQLKGGYFYKAK